MPKSEIVGQINDINLEDINERLRIIQRLFDGIFETFGEEYLSEYLKPVEVVGDDVTIDTEVVGETVVVSINPELLEGTERDIELITGGLDPSEPVFTDSDTQLTSVGVQSVEKGGTGVATLTEHGIILGAGTSAVVSLAEATNGQIAIGSTGNDPVLATLTGTTNEITVTNGSGTIEISLPDSIKLDGATASRLLATDASKKTVSSSSDITGAELETLSDGSDADSLHVHPAGTLDATNGENNRVATFTDADSLNGEQWLHFDGSVLTIQSEGAGGTSGLKLGIGSDFNMYTSDDDVYLHNIASEKNMYFVIEDGLFVPKTILTLQGTTGSVSIGPDPPDANYILDMHGSQDILGVKVENALDKFTAFIAKNATMTLELNAQTAEQGYGTVGTITNHSFHARTNNIDAITIDTSQIVSITTAFGNNMNGDTTKNLRINDSGELGWDSSAIVFGSMFPSIEEIIVTIGDSNPTEVSHLNQGTGWTAGELNGVTFSATSTEEHYLTIGTSGKYEILWSMSLHSTVSGAQGIHGGVMVDNVAVRGSGEAHFVATAANLNLTIGSPAIIDLPNGNEEISLWTSNTHGDDVHVGHASVTIKKIN